MNIDHQLERQLGNMEIPQINVHDQVMQRIQTARKSSYHFRFRGVVLTAIIAVLVLGTGFASVMFINLYNQDGQLTFSIKGLDKDNTEPILTDQQTKEYLQLIEPGEAIALYIPDGNPQNIVSIFQKPIEITDYAQLQFQVRDTIYLPKDISSPFEFMYGIVHYEVEEPTIQRLIKKSEENNGNIVFEKLKLTEEVMGTTLYFNIDGEEYSVAKMKGDRWNSLYTNMDKMKQKQKINVNGSEGLLSYQDGNAEFVWHSAGSAEDAFYSISTKETSNHIESNIVALVESLAKIQ